VGQNELEYQKSTNKFIKDLMGMIEKAKDLDERRFVLNVAEPRIRNFIITSNDYGLFEHWWNEPILKKEAKDFTKNPNNRTFSTIKLNAYGDYNGEEYTVLFHYKTPAKYYYKSILKKKMTYAANNGKLFYLKLTKIGMNDKEIPVYEQGEMQDQQIPFAKHH
jgi:hypothetical protein